LEAYSTTKTSRTTTLNLADLRQGGNECVVDFYPRVIRVIDDIEAMTPANFAAPAAPFPAEFLAIQAFVAVGAAVKRDCVNTLVKTGATQAFNFIGLHLFIAGLKPYLREEIMKAPPADLYAAFQAASALEKIHTEPRKSTSATQNVYEVAADASDKRDDNGGDEEVEAECAALSARIKNLRSKQKKTGGKTASPNKQSKSKAAAAAIQSKQQRLQQMPLLQNCGASAEKLLYSHTGKCTNGGQTGPSFPIKRRANWGAATAVPEPTAAVPRTNDANAAAATTTAIWPGQPVPSPSL
jgi:hypothetical protein